MNEIIQGDCIEEMRKFPDKSFDLVLTDPPYNVDFGYDSIDDKRGDYEVWCREWFKECVRLSDAILLTPGIVNVGMWSRIAEPKWIVAWLKPAAMGRSPFGFCNWEPVLFYGKTKKQKGVDVVTAPIIPNRELEDHPCPKPLEWGKSLIDLVTNEGDTVLDPFAGSGTTLVAAKHLKRNYIGIEISEKYCGIVRRRLEQDMLF